MCRTTLKPPPSCGGTVTKCGALLDKETDAEGRSGQEKTLRGREGVVRNGRAENRLLF